VVLGGEAMKTIVVLGMHRSATSLVAKGLHHEIDMGPDLWVGENPTQPHGHYESRSFVSMNDRILKLAGGHWQRPPPEQHILAVGEDIRDEIKELVEAAGKGKEIWGWKDPRTTLTIKCYLPFLENPHFVPVFRDPKEVVKSLVRRNGNKPAYWVRVVREYNYRLLSFLSEFSSVGG